MAAWPLWVLTCDFPSQSRCIIRHLEGPECVVSSFQSTHLQLLFKNHQVSTASVPQQQGTGSSASLSTRSRAQPLGSLPVPLGSGHSESSPSPWTIGSALKGRVVGFSSWFIYIKGRILRWKFSGFWTGQRSDSCDPPLRKEILY